MEACLSALRGWIKEAVFKDQSQYASAWLSGSRVLFVAYSDTEPQVEEI